MAPVAPSETQTIRSCRKPEDFWRRRAFGFRDSVHMGDDRAVLALAFTADAVALIDKKQGDRLIEKLKTSFNRLHAAEHNRERRLLSTEARAKKSSGSPLFTSKRLILLEVLLAEFFDVSETEDATFRSSKEFCDNKTFPGARWQDNASGVVRTLKVFDGSTNGLFLVGTERKRSGHVVKGEPFGGDFGAKRACLLGRAGGRLTLAHQRRKPRRKSALAPRERFAAGRLAEFRKPFRIAAILSCA